MILLKIAFVYDAIYPYVKGGVEKRVWELAIRLASRGHEVHLFGMKYWEGNKILKKEGVILHGICPVKKLYVNGRRSIGEALFFGLLLIYPLLKIKFDIIDCQQFPYFPAISARFVSIINKTRLVITWHEVWGDYWYDYLGWKGLFGKEIEQYVASFQSQTIAVSSTTSDHFNSNFGKPVNIIITNGINIQSIKSVPPSNEKSDIIFVGRLIKEKNVNLLVRAFWTLLPEHPDLKMTIIGDGPEKNNILLQVRAFLLRDKISLIDFQDQHEEIIARIKSSKVCVIPSTREGFGITALEALRCGLPVVTTDHPANAIKDLITDKTGFLCSLSLPTDLEEKICTALKHCHEMKDNCIKSAEPYNWDQITDRIEKYYESLL